MSRSEAPGLEQRTSAVWAGVVLATTMACASLYQYAVAALSPTLVTQLHLSRVELGFMSSAYYITAAAASWMLGRLVDRISVRIGNLILYGLSTAAFVLLAAIATTWVVILAAGVAGIAIGLSNPVTNLIVTARPGGHGLLVGLKQAGVQLAVLVAGTALPPLALLVGWRPAIAVGIGVLVALALLTNSSGTVRGAGPQVAPPVRAPTAGPRRPLPPAIRYLCGYAFLMGAGMSTVNTYVVLYGREDLGMTPGTAGLLLALIGLAGATVRVVSSVLAERGAALARWLASGAIVAVLGVVLLTATGNPEVAWVGALILGSSAAAWNGVVMLAVLRTTPGRNTGHATGVVLAGFFLGLGLAPPLFGALVDHSHSYALGWLLTGCCFGLAGCVSQVMSRRFTFAPVNAATTPSDNGSVAI